MYELTNVTKVFEKKSRPVTALDGVNLTIGDGEFLAVRGPTGQGKSTLLGLLGGLDRPTAGRVLFDGRDLGAMREGEVARLRARAFGFVFQTFNLLPTLSAQENVETALVPFGVKGPERRRRALASLQELGLGDRASHLPTELSGGQQQRVAIARALVKEPRVLLADEPTGNLDEETRGEIMAVLEGLWRSRGLTLVIVTHDSFVAGRAQRVVVMRAGRISVERAHAATTAGAAGARGPGFGAG